MPLLVDGPARSDSVALAVGRLIATAGVPALSLRAVAAASGVSPSGLVAQFGGRDRMLEVSAGILGRARIEAILRRRGEGVLAFLPASDDSVVDTRVWLGVCELGRGHVGVGYRVSATRREERQLLGWVLDGAPDRVDGEALGDDDLDTLMAVVDGLNAGLCDPDDPLHLSRARGLLAAHRGRRLRSAS
jgi:AcrR family transcriptional regulator